MSHVAVLGGGAWGTALSKVLADQGETVRMWCYPPEHAPEVESARRNERFLPGIELPPTLHATGDLEEALGGCNMAVLVVPSHAFRATLDNIKELLPAEVPIVSATKGIENDTLMLMSEILDDVLGERVRSRAAFLSGPSFAKEVALRKPTNVVVAAADHALSVRMRDRFATDRFRVYSSDDPHGVEVGGALKNVIAIAAGACDALELGHNARAALITRGLTEISRIVDAKGGDPITVAGLSGLGDLVLTCTGSLSRNRTVGYEMGKGRTLDDVLDHLGHVAEGVKTAKSTYDLANQLGVELPICFEVYRVLYEGKSPIDAVDDIMTRPLKKEQLA